MDSNNEPNQQQKSNQVLDAAKQQGQQAIQKMAKEGIKKGAAKASANAVGGSVTTGALAAILPYLLIALLIIICILIIIGFIAFVVTMPGMMQAKIDDIFTNMSTSIQSIYKGDVDATVTEKDVIELANYINGMEYDLIGYGFVQPDKDSTVKTIEQLREAGYSVNTEKNPDKKNDDDGEPEDLIFLVDENGNKYNQKWYYTDGKKYGTDGKVAKESDGSYTRYEITYDSLNKITTLPDATSNSSILRTYAMSERRLYVLRNNDQGFFETFATWLNEVLNGYSGAWAQGLLELFPAVNGRADEGRYNLWDSIKKVSKVKITGDNKLSIDVGWFNEPMKFELEGWSGRYGLSTDFLISLHLATLSPELVTTLVQNYDTRAQIYLDHITGATVTSYFHTEDMKDNEGNPEYVALDKFKEYKKDNKWNLLDGWFLSKKEAKKIMKEIGIESLESGKYTCGGEDPSQVIYYSGEGSDRVNGDCFTQTFDDIDWYDNVFKDQYFLDKHSFSSWEDALNIQVINTDNGEKASNTKKDKHVIVEKSTTIVAEAASAAEEPNDDNEDLQDDSGNNGSYSVENISVTMSSNNKDFRTGKLKKVLGMLDVYYDAINTSTDLNIVEFKNEEDCPLNFCSIFNPESEHYFENYLSYSEFKSMPKDKDIYYECEVAVWKTNDDGLKEGDEGYDMAKDGEIVLSLLVRRTGADQNFDLAAIAYRNYSLEEMMENGMDPSKPSGHTLCSDSSSDAVCSTCRRYISDIISALGKIQDDSYETYEPYIARVVGSWFRDTYFIVPEKDDDATNIVYDEYGKKYYPKGSLTLGEVEVIQNDEEFLKETDELWTDYLYDDRNIDYALFVINPDGSYLNSDSDFEDWKNYYPDLPNEIYDSIGVLTKDGEDYYGYINVYPDSNPANIPLDTDIELLFEENNVPFIKRARVNKLTAGGTANSTGGWSAYSYSENWSDEKVAIDVIDAPGKIQKVHAAYNFKNDEPENIFYYSIKAKKVVAQMEDGQRGMTNEKIKYLFKNKKYYKYDGTTQTAFDIRDDWNEVLDIFSEAKPMKKENVKATLKETARTAVKIALFGWTNLFDNYDENIDSARETVMDGYIDKVYLREDLSATGFDNFKFARDFDDDGIADLASENLKGESSYKNLEIKENTKFSNDPRNPDLINNIDLTTESLAAFSILENTHTPDADYAYRDFKELICELDYFDKEDLTEQATDILEWILPESGSAEWPVRKYDKLNEFGSLIHSKSMYETLNEIMLRSANGGVQQNQLPSGGPESTGNQVSNDKIFEGFEKGQPVVIPATAKILEIGTVEVNNENTSSIMQRFYISDDTTNTQSGNTDEEEELITVTETQYNAIESTAQAFENESDSTFGKTYETGYIKLEVIGKESLVNIQQNCKDANLDVTYLEYFLDNYGFKDENNDGIDDDGKTICESYIIYIEGIELRYNQNGDWTFDNTIISEIIKTKSNSTNTVPQTITSGTVYRGDLLTEDVSNTIILFNAQTGSDQTYNIDNYTKREIPEYYPLGKRQDLSRMEDRKIAGTSIIETVNNEIYLKAGTLIGLTGDSNIKIIMKNREGAVVENVEDYLEIEDGKSQSGLTSDLMNFYFLPYESGGSKVGTYTHGTCSTGECAIGIIQWTTLSTADGANYSLSGVQNLCKFLYEADSSFCGILAPYANWTDSQVYNDIKSGSSEIGAAFKKLDDQNHEKLLSLEIQCAEDGFYSFIESKGTSWVLERTSGLIGSYYSLLAWAPNAGWESAFDQSKTDKQMLLDLMYKACQNGSTIGKLNHRWHSQCRLGVDMIEGTVSEEQVVEWIEENDKSEIYDRYKYGANGAASNHASYGPGDYIYDERGG